MNFVHGLPHICISVGLLIDKVAEIGIVYNPILEQLFTARKGQGAFLNGAPIQVSGKKGNFPSLREIRLNILNDFYRIVQSFVNDGNGYQSGSGKNENCMAKRDSADAKSTWV